MGIAAHPTAKQCLSLQMDLAICHVQAGSEDLLQNRGKRRIWCWMNEKFKNQYRQGWRKIEGVWCLSLKQRMRKGEREGGLRVWTNESVRGLEGRKHLNKSLKKDLVWVLRILTMDLLFNSLCLPVGQLCFFFALEKQKAYYFVPSGGKYTRNRNRVSSLSTWNSVLLCLWAMSGKKWFPPLTTPSCLFSVCECMCICDAFMCWCKALKSASCQTTLHETLQCCQKINFAKQISSKHGLHQKR